MPIFAFIILFLFTPLTFHLITYSQSVNTDKQVVYQYPYPGILPDHPLYFLKAARDRALDIMTREPLKKAELYLLLSDKRAASALQLAQKGKVSLAVTTVSKGEKYFFKIPPLLTTAKTQGKGPTPEFVDKVRVSNRKHRESLDELLKGAPQKERPGLNEIVRLNEQIRGQLRTL